jgi:hypothetical protein
VDAAPAKGSTDIAEINLNESEFLMAIKKTKLAGPKAAAKKAVKAAAQPEPYFEMRFAPKLFSGLSQAKKVEVANSLNASIQEAIQEHLPKMRTDIARMTKLDLSNLSFVSNKKSVIRRQD